MFVQCYDRLTEDVDFGKKKDGDHFDLGGYVNKLIFCIWGTENPHAYIEKPTHPKRGTVALSAAELMSFAHLGAAF